MARYVTQSERQVPVADECDVLVAGAGPAGIAAAIQLHRYGLRPRIYEYSDSPGLLKNANLVENYPGFPEGITGPELFENFRKQLDKFSPDIVKRRVERVVVDQDRFIIDAGGDAARFKYVVLATGTKPKKLDIPHPKDRVFYEVSAVPDKIKDILILGGGDAAFDYALNLNSRGKKVSVLCRSREPKCLRLLEQRCQSAGIEVALGTSLLAVTPTEAGLELELESGGRVQTEALLCALGREPALDMLDEDLCKAINTTQKIPGLYPVGDVVNGLNRQAAIAVGDGLKAAMEIKELIG